MSDERDFRPPWDRVYLALEAYLVTWHEIPRRTASDMAYGLADVAQCAHDDEAGETMPKQPIPGEWYRDADDERDVWVILDNENMLRIASPDPRDIGAKVNTEWLFARVDMVQCDPPALAESRERADQDNDIAFAGLQHSLNTAREAARLAHSRANELQDRLDRIREALDESPDE